MLQGVFMGVQRAPTGLHNRGGRQEATLVYLLGCAARES